MTTSVPIKTRRGHGFAFAWFRRPGRSFRGRPGLERARQSGIGAESRPANVKVGDQWRFVMTPSTNPNLAWVVRSVTPAVIEGMENGAPLLLTPDLDVLESPRRKDSDRRLLSLPLEEVPDPYRCLYTFELSSSSWSHEPRRCDHARALSIGHKRKYVACCTGLGAATGGTAGKADRSCRCP
jgi:hypothetical protein